LFDLYRKDAKTNQKFFLTKEKPILISTQKETKSSVETFEFVDQSVPLGNYIYELRGIDLFGQVGNPIFSKPVSVEDTQAPPPPLGLRAQLKQPGYPWRTERQLETLRSINGKAQLELQFEFGELLRQQAPDAKLFQLYWRQDDLLKVAEVTTQVDQSLVDNEDAAEHLVNISGISQDELKKFRSGFITNVLDRGQTLPANQRQRFKVIDVSQDNPLSLRTSNKEGFVGGTYKLISEPHDPSSWSHINQGGLTKSAVKPPVTGKLTNTSGTQFSAKVLSAVSLGQPSNSLPGFPTGARDADVFENELDAVQAKTEVVLDIALAEASFLVGGRLRVSGSEHRILYASVGLLSEISNQTVTRIGLVDNVNLRPGQSCVVRPNPSFEAKVMQVQEGNKGSFIVDIDAVPSIFNLTNLIEGAITDLPTQQKYFSILGAEPISDQLRLTVRPLKASDSLPEVGSSILVTPPQFIELVIQEDNPIPDYAKNVVGGEVAFDEIIATDNGEEVKTHILRSLSGIYANRAGQFSILVRLPEQVIETLDLLIPNKPLRYHPPYRFQLDVDVVQRREADLDLVIPPQEGTRRAYFAVLTEDEAGNSSPLTVPVQVTAVKPPPTGKPGRPYPCGLNETSEAGYATPPDRQGRATLCVAWKAGDLTPADGLRYEVARALDNTVVATDRQNWLLGKSVPGLPPVRVQIISIQPLAEGVLEVTAQRVGAEPDYALAAFDKGLLHQGGENFRVQTVPTESGGNWVFQVMPESERELLQAEADLLPLPIAPGEQMRGEIGVNITRQANGIFRVEVGLASELRGAVEGLRHGKLTKPLSGGSGAGATPEGAQGGVPEHPTFQITGAQQGEGNSLILLLRPANFSVVPAVDGSGAGQTLMVWRGEQRTLSLSGACLIEAPPDYSRILTEDEPLRKLAEKPGNEEAFGLVTGVPLKEEQARGMCGQQAGNGGSRQAQNQPFCFRDEIPGIGSNRFFYRVRAVDAAENRSSWSEVSVPFYQVDTTPPKLPVQLGGIPGHETAELVWLPSNETGIVGYQIYRTESDELSNFDFEKVLPHAVISLEDIKLRPLRINAHQLVLPMALADIDPSSIDVRLLSVPPNTPNLFVQAQELTKLEDRYIHRLNPLVPNGTPVHVLLGDPTEPILLTNRPGSGEPLLVQDRTVDLTFGLDVTGIETLLLAGQIPEDEDLETLLSQPNALQEDGVMVDIDTLKVTGLRDILPDGIAVAVIVRLADDRLRVIHHAPGTLDLLQVIDGEVRLDLKISGDSIQNIYALSGKYAVTHPARGKPDLCLKRASQLVLNEIDGTAIAINNLNPLVPNGTAVIVALKTNSGNELTLTGDPSQFSWTESHLQAEKVYYYGLAVRKRVIFGTTEGATGTRELEIVSSIAGPVTIRPFASPIY
jgi:hypothetical protein